MGIVKRQLEYHNGVYSVHIDITTDEWESMLLNDSIFNHEALDMVKKWYVQTDHQATAKEIVTIYSDEYSNHKSSPFNGIVSGLSQRIIKYLNRFEVIGTKGGKSYFIIPFEGWHKNYLQYGPFVWKLRKELVKALENLGLVGNFITSMDSELETVVIGESEGNKKQYYVVKYERNHKNRENAIKIHGTVCCVCGFDFEYMYGLLGKGYIEVHHVKPLSSRDEEVIVNPKTDLVCVCSNCHRMIHKNRDKIISPQELREVILGNRDKIIKN